MLPRSDNVAKSNATNFTQWSEQYQDKILYVSSNAKVMQRKQPKFAENYKFDSSLTIAKFKGTCKEGVYNVD